MMRVDSPALFPSVGLRGLTSPRGFIDTGIDAAVGGRVYLEEQTVHEAAILFGYASPEEQRRNVSDLAGARAEIAAMQRELSRLRPIADAVREAATASA